MALNRRTFIELGSLAACGAALNPPGLLATVPRALAGGLPLLAGDEAVLAFVRGYSGNLRVVGASVLGRLRTSGLRALDVIVEVADMDRLQAALAGIPFPDIFTQGNTLSFALADVDVTIENLVPDDFAARLAAMEKRAANAFAHDGLAYNPRTRELSDLFGARVGELKMVNKTFGGVAALKVVLRGMLEAAQLGLSQGVEFLQWRGRMLRMIARAGDARRLVEDFLQQLAALAEKLPAGGMETLLRSRLIRTAFQEVLGMDTAGAVAEFKRLRVTTAAETSNAALWLAVLISPEIKSDAATTLLHHGARFEVLRSRSALGQARKLLNN